MRFWSNHINICCTSTELKNCVWGSWNETLGLSGFYNKRRLALPVAESLCLQPHFELLQLAALLFVLPQKGWQLAALVLIPPLQCWHVVLEPGDQLLLRLQLSLRVHGLGSQRKGKFCQHLVSDTVWKWITNMAELKICKGIILLVQCYADPALIQISEWSQCQSSSSKSELFNITMKANWYYTETETLRRGIELI